MTVAATTWCVVYNGTESAQVLNDEGKTVYPTEFACARRSEVRDLIDSGYLVVVDMDGITDGSSPAARMAKQEAKALNDKIDAEKAVEEDKTEVEPEPKKATRSASSKTAQDK